MVSDFSDYCCSSLENENTLAIERRKHFTEAVTQRCSSNLCLAAIIKIILKSLWRSQILKKFEINSFHFKGLHLSCKKVMLRNGFSLKHLSMATGNFWPEPCRVMFVYWSKIQDIKKNVVKTLLNFCEHQKNFSVILKSKIF